MARPIKEGFDYFPFDVNLDRKIQAVESVFKNNGFVWIVKFWQTAYQTNTGEVSLDGYHGIIQAENSRITTEEQTQIIKMCVEIGLLYKTDAGLYTSNGIKKRMLFFLREREKWRNKAKNEITPKITPKITPGEGGKVKEIKERINTIVSFLNSACNTQFKPTSSATARLISARISEGYSDEEFKAVILYKQKEWGKNNDMRQYLRPITLFGTKFESYLQACKLNTKPIVDAAAKANLERNAGYMDMILATEPIKNV